MGLAEAGGDGDEIGRHVGKQDAFLLQRALAGEALAKADGLGESFAAMRVAGEQPQADVLVAAGEMIDAALLGVDQWCQLGQEHLAYRVQLALALQHAGEFGEVCL